MSDPAFDRGEIRENRTKSLLAHDVLFDLVVVESALRLKGLTFQLELSQSGGRLYESLLFQREPLHFCALCLFLADLLNFNLRSLSKFHVGLVVCLVSCRIAFSWLLLIQIRFGVRPFYLCELFNILEINQSKVVAVRVASLELIALKLGNRKLICSK